LLEHPISRIVAGVIIIVISVSLIKDSIEQFRDPGKDKLGYWKWSALPSGIIASFIGIAMIIHAIWQML
jgi:hypothetical protein